MKHPVACPIGFLTSGSVIEKDCKKDFNKYQYTKKFVFQCHTVTHGIDVRKSPLGWYSLDFLQRGGGGKGTKGAILLSKGDSAK